MFRTLIYYRVSRTIKRNCLMAGRLRWSFRVGRSRVTTRTSPKQAAPCLQGDWRGPPHYLARAGRRRLLLVARSEADMSRLLQLVDDFCTWSGMRNHCGSNGRDGRHQFRLQNRCRPLHWRHPVCRRTAHGHSNSYRHDVSYADAAETAQCKRPPPPPSHTEG